MSNTEEPDPPEWAKSARWIWHHIKREGSVIRSAPGAFIMAILVVGMGEYWLLSERFEDKYSGQIAGLQATIQDQQATIQYEDTRLAP